MTMVVLTVFVWLYLADTVTPQPGLATDIITDAVLADIGGHGVPFPLSLINDYNRGHPNNALNIGESFFLSRLHQGDPDALLHLDQLHHSVNNPVSLMHQLFHILRQPQHHRGSNLLGQLHNLAITRGLIPNTHAFVVRRPQSSVNPRTPLTTLSPTWPNHSTQLRGQDTIQQQIIETMNKGNGNANEIDLAKPTPTERTETTRKPRTIQDQNAEFVSTYTVEPRGQILSTRSVNNIEHSESNVNQQRQSSEVINSGGRLWNIVGQLNNKIGAVLDTRTVTLKDLISSNNPREIGARLTQTFTTKIPHRLITQTMDLKPMTKVVSKMSTLPTLRDMNFEVSLKPIPFFSLRIGRVALQPIRSSDKSAGVLKRAGHGNINEEDMTIEIPKDIVITNLSVIVEDSTLDLGRPTEIDVFSDDATNQTQTKAEFILQEVGELDLKPKDASYQFVGDVYNRNTGPKSRIGKQGKVNMERRRQYLMQLQSDSGNFDNTVIAESIGPWVQLPGEVIRIHGNDSTRLVTREKVIIERLGFVKFQVSKPVGIEKSSYRLKYVTVPVLRIDVSRRDYLSHNNTSDKPNRSTIIQYVGDILVNRGNSNINHRGSINTASPDGLNSGAASEAVKPDAKFNTTDASIAPDDNVNNADTNIKAGATTNTGIPVEKGKTSENGRTLIERGNTVETAKPIKSRRQSVEQGKPINLEIRLHATPSDIIYPERQLPSTEPTILGNRGRLISA